MSPAPATTVVVKVLKRDLADNPRSRQFFERAAAYTARLRHPDIVLVPDASAYHAIAALPLSPSDPVHQPRRLGELDL